MRFNKAKQDKQNAMQNRTNTHEKKTAKNMHREDIIAELKKRGWSLSGLAREYGLGDSTVRAALDRPYPKCEKIIANALEKTVAEIWPEREAKRNFKPTLKAKV